MRLETKALKYLNDKNVEFAPDDSDIESAIEKIIHTGDENNQPDVGNNSGNGSLNGSEGIDIEEMLSDLD